jgi:2-hydroxy-3-keto-5-methylthiopentenyl-1-phosphate phosphatase
VIDQLIARFAVDDRWKELERLWQLKEIGSRQCLTEELALIRITDAQLEGVLANIRLDPGAIGLLKLLSDFHVPVTVLSDGLDLFIKTILEGHDLCGLDILSNVMVRQGDRICIEFPHGQKSCEVSAGHCKCASACETAVPGRQSIYIGDGQSDLCAARKAGYVFAKAKLAECLDAERIPYRRFSSLEDIRHLLHSHWGKQPNA